EIGITCRQNTARHRREMRYKCGAQPGLNGMASRQRCCLKFLRNLRQVTMPVEVVGTDVFIGLGIVRAWRGAASRAADARLRVYNHVRFNDACSQGRKQGKNCSGGIAPWIGDKRGVLYALAVALTQSIDGAPVQRRRGRLMRV